MRRFFKSSLERLKIILTFHNFFTWKFLDVPDAPIVTEVNCNERRAILRWRRPDDNGDQIKQFLVQMHTEFEEVCFI